MKKHFLLALFSVLLSYMAHATIHTVSNSAAIPAQDTSLNTAIASAASGDTIYVMGTPNTYWLTSPLTKPLTFIGTGFNPQKEIPAITTIAGSGNLAMSIKSGASGSNFVGIVFSYGLTLNDVGTASISNLSFEFCLTNNNSSINLSNGTTATTISNIVIKNCGNAATSMFEFIVNNTGASTNNIMISNSVIDVANAINTSSSTNTVYDHNIITNPNYNFYFFNNSSITNNIIIQYYDDNIDGTNLLLNNNINVQWGTSFPSFSGSGSGNIAVSDIDFTCANAGSQSCSGTINYHLQPSSPGAGYALDGTDVGVYGGTSSYYWSGEPQWFPVVSKFDILNSTVSHGGTLNIHVESREAKDGQ